MGVRRALSRPRGQGRREHRKHVTRRELLAAGRRLFSEKGLYDSRIEDLSREAGIGKGTLYLYFESRERLIEAVVRNGFTELLGFVHREAQAATSHREVVARVAQAHLTFFGENPDLLRVFHQVRGLIKFNGPAWRPLRRALEEYLGGLAHVLCLQHPAWRGTDRMPRDVAKLLFGAVSGVTSVRASLNGTVPKRAHQGATVRALVGLVLAYEGPGGLRVERTDAR